MTSKKQTSDRESTSDNDEILGYCPGCGYAFTEEDIVEDPPIYGEAFVRCPNYDGTTPDDEHANVLTWGSPWSMVLSRLDDEPSDDRSDQSV